jgi:hypothetical protein
MTTILLTIAITLLVLFFTLRIRSTDLREPAPISPIQHLEDRKAAIYENLRDLQFEFRLGKLSDADYQTSKLTLQKELTGVLAEIESISAKLPATAKPTSAPATTKRPAAKPTTAQPGLKCPHCGATFDKPLKFCGECGKAMA